MSPSLNSFSSLKPPGYYPITESIVTQLLSTEMSLLVVAIESKAIIINRVNSVDMAKYIGSSPDRVQMVDQSEPNINHIVEFTLNT